MTNRSETSKARGFSVSVLFMLMTVLSLAVTRLGADTIKLRDGKIVENTSVGSLNDETVSLDSGKKLNMEDIESIRFALFAVPPKATGIVLNDGTSLNGVILKRETKMLHFRSASLGKMEIPTDAVAVVFYHFYQNMPENIAVEDRSILIERSGRQRSGRVLWFDAETVGFMSERGLERIEVNRINSVFLGNLFDGDRDYVRVRNGDIIPGGFRVGGRTVRVTVLGKVYPLPMKALAEIHIGTRSKRAAN